MSNALHWAALAAYLAGTVVFLLFLVTQRRGLHRMGQAVLWAGFALHTLALATVWIGTGVVPMTSLRQSLDALSWAVMGASLVLNLRLGVMILGAFSAPLCLVLLVGASVVPAAEIPAGPAFKNLWIVVHVLCLLAGYGLLAVTFLGSVLYLLQDRALRHKKMGPLFRRLPSLARLDQLGRGSLVSGFLLMTVGLVSGAVYAQIALGSYWRWDPKEVWALVTWFLYAALVHTRVAQGWRGRRGAWLAIAAFAALMFTFLGAGIFLSGYHGFGAFPSLGGELK